MAEDPELKAMAAIKAALEPLDAETRGHVLRWAADRFSVELPNVDTKNNDAGGGGTGGGGGKKIAARDFEEISDLFVAANPGTDNERVLVATYWLQVKGGEASVGSQKVNDELKNLGHPVANITRAYDRLKEQKPALVMQVKKSGTSKQARKMYKLTNPGIDRVEAMAAGTYKPDSE